MSHVNIRIVSLRSFLGVLLIATIYANVQGQCPVTIPIWDQQKLMDTMALYPNCEHYPKGLQIVDSELTDLTPLSSLKSVKFIHIDRDSSLQSLHGLHNIETVESFTLGASPLIADLSGFDGLRTVEGDFTISDMSLVQSLDGLGSLEEVGGNVSIWGMCALNDTKGINNLISVGANLSITACDNLNVINGFDGLAAVEGNLFLTGSTLENIEGFQSLSIVGGKVDLRAPAHVNFNALAIVGKSFDMDGVKSLSLEVSLKLVKPFFLEMVLKVSPDLITSPL